MRILLCYFLIAILIVGCGKNNDTKPEAKVTKIEFADASLDLLVGENKTLSVIHYPSDLSSPDYEWSTSDKSIVLVENGKISALKVGEVKITVVAKGLNINSSLMVKVLPIGAERLILNPDKSDIRIGENITIEYSILPSNTTGIEFKKVEWSSSDESIAVVKDGIATGVGVGKADITATITGTNILGQSTINVLPIPVESVSLSKSESKMDIGSTLLLQAKILPTEATNKSVKWESSDASIATVKDGLVTAIKAGTVDIKLISEDGGKVAICRIEVNPQGVKQVILNKLSADLWKDDYLNLIADVKPSDAVNKNVIWSSSNASIATVDQNGKVTAKSAGTVLISATSEDNPFINAQCAINVKTIESVVSAHITSSATSNIGGSVTGSISSALINSSDKIIKFISYEIKDNSGRVVLQSKDQQNIDPMTRLTLSGRISNAYLPKIYWIYEFEGTRYQIVVNIIK